MNIAETLEDFDNEYLNEQYWAENDYDKMSQDEIDKICNDNSVALISFLILYGLGLIFVIANLIRTECCPRCCKKEKNKGEIF